MAMNKNKLCIYIPLICVIFYNTSCVNDFLPEKLDAYDVEARFTQTVYKPQLGRTNLMTNNFNSGNSTLPMTFEITNIQRSDGSPAPELTEYFPVKVWKTPYLGTEKTLSEIETKRDIEYRQLFQVRKHSGEFILWPTAVSSFVLCAPDSCYTFDVLSQNSGGYVYTTRMRLIPEREVEYVPNNIDTGTGISTVEYVHPTTVSYHSFSSIGGYQSAIISASTGRSMYEEDIKVYFVKNIDNTSSEKTLTFRFYQEDYTPINPDLFNVTEWESLVHGFDMEKTSEYVRYKVAYPIPLMESVSKYTNKDGDKASVKFSYNRIDGSGRRVPAFLTFDFAIYNEGHWEVIFVFEGKGPFFKDGVFEY
jgi:hypothetical protein